MDMDDSDWYSAEVYVRGTNLLAKFSKQSGNVKTDYQYYTQNAHGDVVNLTDSTGAITKSYKYDAFGVEQNVDDADNNAFRYCGEYYDFESGTIYLRARYYDPTIGRFISRDSVTGENTDPLSLNLYTYCHNNPILGVDPSGHWLNFVIGAAVGAVISGVTTAISTYKENGKVDWSSTLVSAATGAVGGAIAASGMGLLAQAVWTGVSSGVGNFVDQGINFLQRDKDKIDPLEIASNTVGGFAGSALGSLTAKAAPYVSSKVSRISRAMDDSLNKAETLRLASKSASRGIFTKESSSELASSMRKTALQGYAKAYKAMNTLQGIYSVQGSVLFTVPASKISSALTNVTHKITHAYKRRSSKK